MRAIEKGLIFEVSVSDRVPGEMLIDGPRLRQIVMNVAGNAVKFTSQGGVFLHADHAGGELRIVVRDTGPGMTVEQQRRLFMPFDQTHKSVSSKYGGTGLGLVLSKQLAKLMGGHLLLKDSTPGRGSAFEILVAAPVVTKKPELVKTDSLPAQQSI
jgi:signal transduction histidine kinase